MESDAGSCWPPFRICPRGLCAEDVSAVGPGWVPDAVFSVAKRVAEGQGVSFVRVCSEIKELRSLLPRTLNVTPAALFQLPHLPSSSTHLPITSFHASLSWPSLHLLPFTPRPLDDSALIPIHRPCTPFNSASTRPDVIHSSLRPSGVSADAAPSLPAAWMILSDVLRSLLPHRCGSMTECCSDLGKHQ